MKTFKKSVAVFLSLLMIISAAPFGAFAQSEIAENEELLLPDFSSVKVPEGYALTGKQNFDKDGNAVFEIESAGRKGEFSISKWIYASGKEASNPDIPLAYPENKTAKPMVKAELYPSSYDARDYGYITPVETQVGGTCWAHAAIACIEANYIKNGYGDTLDLSEYHTIWFGKNSYVQGVDDSKNDGRTVKNSDSILNDGGNSNDVGYAVLNFSGPVLESSFPFETTNEGELLSEMASAFNYDNRFIGDTVVENILSIPYNVNNIKAGIKDYGAVCAMIYSSGSYYNRNYYNLRDGQTLCYFDPYEDEVDHAITLVGWDDNYSRDNFGTVKPENDGAWLVKNSWGTKWGENGYFWLSYEDKSLARYDAEVFEVADKAEYENVYMYDGIGYSATFSSGAKGAANVFRTEGDEKLTKVSYGDAETKDYTLKIYKNLPENYTAPTQGTLALTQTGNTNGKRYIDINGEIILEKGELFAVVIETENIHIENKNHETPYENYYFNSKAGESFIEQSNGKWIDSNKEGYNNVCVRAVTETIEPEASYQVTFTDGDAYSEIITTNGSTVVLPKKDGHTYVFTYNGTAYTGGTTDSDMTVSMHCYPTEGKKVSGEECKTVFECIYCLKEMKEAEINHSCPKDGTVSKTDPCVIEFNCEYCGTQIKEPVKTHPNQYGTKGLSETCTEDGFTGGIYCPDCKTYLSGHTVIKATNHAKKYEVKGTDATCTEAGFTGGIFCPDCQTYLSGHTAIKATGHSEYTSVEAVAATCITQGRTAETRCSVCQTVIKASKLLPTISHKDNDGDGLCNDCGIKLEKVDPSKKCSCNCHKSGFMGFIWKIQNFFNKLFKSNPVCACGVKHY